MDGLAGIVRAVEKALTVAAEMTIEDHLEIRMGFNQIIPKHLPGRITGNIGRCATSIIGLQVVVREQNGGVTGVLRLGSDPVGPTYNIGISRVCRRRSLARFPF